MESPVVRGVVLIAATLCWFLEIAKTDEIRAGLRKDLTLSVDEFASLKQVRQSQFLLWWNGAANKTHWKIDQTGKLVPGIHRHCRYQ